MHDPGPGDASQAQIVAAYWTNYRLSTSANRADRMASEDWFWAWEAVEQAVDQRDAALIPLLIALADAVAGDEAALAYLGAGPLENLLRHRGPEFATPLLDEIDGAARRNGNFRTALRCVWWDVDDDPARVERFQRFGPPL